MSFWKEHSTTGAKISASALTTQPPTTKSVRLLSDADQRERLLSAYTYSMEQLLQEQERRDENGGNDHRHSLVNGNAPSQLLDDEDSSDGKGGCCYGVNKCLHSINEDLVPYKMLYMFMRGGEACVSLYLSVFGLQIGFTPLQLSFIYALPLLISAVTTPLCGFFADKFRCRKEMLLFALCLWVFFSLTINMVPAPELESCDLARKQFNAAVAKVNLPKMKKLSISNSLSSSDGEYRVDNAVGANIAHGLLKDFGESHLDCLIPNNTTDARSKSWSSVLQVINTPWTPKTEKCFPGGGFWEEAPVPIGTVTHGPQNTFRGWIFERESLMSSFYAIFALLTVAMVMQGPTISLTDTATLHTLGRERAHEYGWQRAFGNAGFAIYITLVTMLIHLTTSNMDQCQVEIVVSDYRIAFVVFLGTTTCAIALLFAYCIKKEQILPNDSNIFNMRKVFYKPRPCLLLPILCFLAACEGAITVFLPIHLVTLGLQLWILFFYFYHG